MCVVVFSQLGGTSNCCDRVFNSAVDVLFFWFLCGVLDLVVPVILFTMRMNWSLELSAISLMLSVLIIQHTHGDSFWLQFKNESATFSVGAISCHIPNEQTLGVCLEVSKCDAYLKVRNSYNLPAEKVNFLRQVQCISTISTTEVSEFIEPLVCCPSNGQSYIYPIIKFTKFEYRSFSDLRARFKKKKLKRRIHTVESSEGFNLSNECGKQVTNRIYGGEIAELDEYPWLALLIYNTNEFGCSGALISTQHILTAAHCVLGNGVREKNGLKYIRLGEFNVKTEPDCIEEPNYLNCADAALNIGYDKLFVHPEYDENSFNKFNDIAIIRLKHKVSFTHFVMPICLPADNEVHPFEPGQMFSVSGWGRTDLFNKYFINIHSPIKLKLRIPLVSRENCTKVLEKLGVKLGSKQICAGGEFAKDTCAGDSGGPLMYFDRKYSRWVAYGIVSYGFTKCGMAGYPAVYTNVAEYLEWIQHTIHS
ncbi:phenoloxidase-activating factor 1 [Teleopsis dalmanni]|uniref:phenoloxidase-activating factor 1 n=1 Tax=Teleopsis dalmanni TaxID=139649 RepID=UPI0018CE211E|nr:phenoloxidase-activating factor 1 [Teleopsis dalmanni]